MQNSYAEIKGGCVSSIATQSNVELVCDVATKKRAKAVNLVVECERVVIDAPVPEPLTSVAIILGVFLNGTAKFTVAPNPALPGDPIVIAVEPVCMYSGLILSVSQSTLSDIGRIAKNKKPS